MILELGFNNETTRFNGFEASVHLYYERLCAIYDFFFDKQVPAR